MTVITDGLITESDRVTLITATLECTNPVTIRCMTELALKLGVSRELLVQAADCVDECALEETGPAIEVRGYLSECG